MDLIAQDDHEYAEGATLLREKDADGRFCERMGNYDIPADTRELTIQWIKVLLLTHAGREHTSELPPPFDHIMFRTGGWVGGGGPNIRERNMHGGKPHQRSSGKNQERKSNMETREPQDLSK